jgi:hypothetical protein
MQFTAPAGIQPPRRRWSRKERLARLGRDAESEAPEQDLVLVNDPPPASEEELPVEEKSKE